MLFLGVFFVGVLMLLRAFRFAFQRVFVSIVCVYGSSVMDLYSGELLVVFGGLFACRT